MAFLWHTGTHALDRHLKRKGKRGLRHVLRALQEEVLMLGVISLLLVAIEVWGWVWGWVGGGGKWQCCKSRC